MGITLSHHHGQPYMRLIRPGCYEVFCAGCRMAHRIEINARMPDGRIGWDGDIYKPSVTPELVYLNGSNVCAFLLKKGEQDFGANCSHSLAGQTVPLPDFPTQRTTP